MTAFGVLYFRLNRVPKSGRERKYATSPKTMPVEIWFPSASTTKTQPRPIQAALPGALTVRTSPPGDQLYLAPLFGPMDAITLPIVMISLVRDRRAGYVSMSAKVSSLLNPAEVTITAWKSFASLLIRGCNPSTKSASSKLLLGLNDPAKLITVLPFVPLSISWNPYQRWSSTAHQ